MSLAAGPGRGGGGDVSTGESSARKLAVDKHVAYIQSLDTRRDELEYHLTEHLRLNGIYWGLTALHLLGHPDALPRDGLLDFLSACLHDDGGFGAAPGHDAHMLSTVSAVQILSMLPEDGIAALAERRHMPDARDRIAAWIAALQQPDGTFAGDAWGETDTRFLYGALNALSLLGRLPVQRPAEPPLIDVSAAVAYVRACQNADGGFGVAPGDESHAGQVFTCLGALCITGTLDTVLGGDAGKDRLAAWLSERQQPGGGLNGRPEKLVDVCYSWWVITSLAMLDRLHWIDKRKLTEFILECQDTQHGGLSDRPGDMVDVFHTNFGVAGLSLLGHEGVKEVDPVYCMPKSITDKCLGR